MHRHLHTYVYTYTHILCTCVYVYVYLRGILHVKPSLPVPSTGCPAEMTVGVSLPHPPTMLQSRKDWFFSVWVWVESRLF